MSDHPKYYAGDVIPYRGRDYYMIAHQWGRFVYGMPVNKSDAAVSMIGYLVTAVETPINSTGLRAVEFLSLAELEVWEKENQIPEGT